ncbi:MAG: hypothetical protein Tsb005_10520 [Gammaproteobacteria bacterium]
MKTLTSTDQYAAQKNPLATCLPNLASLYDVKEGIVNMSPYMAHLLGFGDPAKAVGHSMHQIPLYKKHPAYLIFDDIFRKITVHKAKMTIISLLKYADGKKVMAFAEKIPHLNAIGEVTHIFTNAIEIHEHSVFFSFLSSLLHFKLYNLEHDTFCYIIEDLPQRNDDYPPLTLRETDCLFYMLHGKTCKEIANILNLSHRTVETYLMNVKQKLGCTTNRTLIDYAVSQGWMHIVPPHIINPCKF